MDVVGLTQMKQECECLLFIVKPNRFQEQIEEVDYYIPAFAQPVIARNTQGIRVEIETDICIKGYVYKIELRLPLVNSVVV